MKTLRVESGFGFELDGTITMDDAGAITYTATAGNEDMMAMLMNESVYVYDGEPRVVHVPKPGQEPQKTRMRAVTRQDDPKLWFEELPQKYHGSAFRVVPLDPTEKSGKVREHLINPRRRRKSKM